MDPPLSRRSEYERENTLYDLFIASNDLSVIEPNRRNNDACWLMALGRYLKTVRVQSHPIASNSSLFQFLKSLLAETLPLTRGLLLILKQCVYLYSDQLTDLSFQRHLCTALPTLPDAYLKYKYVRLLRLIIAETDNRFLSDILPANDRLLEYYHQLDPAIIIVLEKLALIRSDSALQCQLNELYPPTLLAYLQSNDFDDDELIDFCQVLFHINLNNAVRCSFTIVHIFADLMSYIEHDTDTMMNWLLTPETGEKFLLFLLRLVKYLAGNREQFHTEHESHATMKRFYEQLKNAHDKALFPYNIKPLLNAFAAL